MGGALVRQERDWFKDLFGWDHSDGGAKRRLMTYLRPQQLSISTTKINAIINRYREIGCNH